MSTEPVKGGYQSRFGVYNLLGNAEESALDAYDPIFYSKMPERDPYNPLTHNGQLEELSDGSFADMQSDLRAADRNSVNPVSRSKLVGFRCARSVPPPDKKL